MSARGLCGRHPSLARDDCPWRHALYAHAAEAAAAAAAAAGNGGSGRANGGGGTIGSRGRSPSDRDRVAAGPPASAAAPPPPLPAMPLVSDLRSALRAAAAASGGGAAGDGGADGAGADANGHPPRGSGGGPPDAWDEPGEDFAAFVRDEVSACLARGCDELLHAAAQHGVPPPPELPRLMPGGGDERPRMIARLAGEVVAQERAAHAARVAQGLGALPVERRKLEANVNDFVRATLRRRLGVQ